jgi:hypothetical protein
VNDLLDKNAAWLPSQKQEMLLKIALAPEGEARAAGLTWLASVDLANQDAASNRLLPLVHDRLLQEDIDHPVMEILKGVRRKAWCRNQLLFTHTVPVIQALRDTGIEVMLLKGMALTQHYYGTTGLRPMADIDLMVPFRDADSAVEILCKNGWEAERPLPAKLTQEMKLCAHAIGFRDAFGLPLDLHWHLLHFCLDPGADDSFWAASTVSTFAGREVRILNPADQLLHLFVHGLEWCRTPGIRWISDACTVIRRSPDLDWERLIAEARQRNLVLFVRSALNYLADSFDVPVPGEALQSLNCLPVSARERYEYVALTQQGFISYSHLLGEGNSVLRNARVLYSSYRRNAEGAARYGLRLTRGGFLRFTYRKLSNAQLLMYFLARLGQRVVCFFTYKYQVCLVKLACFSGK